MLNEYEYSLPVVLKSALDEIIAGFEADRIIERIWEKDPLVWTGDTEGNWLGWLEIAEETKRNTERFSEFASKAMDEGFTDVVLLGMGGSSLCPDVFSRTFEKKNFHILDSTVPAQIKTLESKINIPTTLFIVASKSGSTLEPNTFKQHFYKLTKDAVGEDQVGNHFVAITDPGSKLEMEAKEERFRGIFYGEPTVGGRFSALSVFGMLPLALMGVDTGSFLDESIRMSDACRKPSFEENPGAALGAILGICHKHGRDKLTLFASEEIASLGSWMEQLVAESTGKNGVAIIPVDGEPIGKPTQYGSDRIFVIVESTGEAGFDAIAAELADGGHPVVRIRGVEAANLGTEFFRWEFATAVAGAIMGINPFDQPDVEAAKIEARKITDAYEETGTLPSEEPFLSIANFEFYGDQEIAAGSFESVKSVLKSHLDRVLEGDYFALLAYVEMNAENEEILSVVRDSVFRKYNVATCLGFGPRFLHSTGQAYKGGAGNGVFLQITSDDALDFGVPGQKYTFGVVKTAQSRGDFQVLLDRERRALRIHIKDSLDKGLAEIAASHQ